MTPKDAPSVLRMRRVLRQWSHYVPLLAFSIPPPMVQLPCPSAAQLLFSYEEPLVSCIPSRSTMLRSSVCSGGLAAAPLVLSK